MSGGSALATYVYGYNSGGLITTETNAEGLATYSYDDTNQLTGVDRPVGQTDETYGYDLNGNRNTSGYSVSGGNTMTASPGYTYTYDAEGNTSAKTETATGKVTTYSYDHRNRLTGVTQKNSGGTVIMQATYTYDALGRRIKTDVDADGAGGGGATVTWSMYDGQNTYADFNSGGTLTMRYLHGLAIDELYARMDSAGTAAWYLTDQLGTIRDIVDASGSNLYHVSYEAFGSVVTTTGTGDRFAFTARELDAVTGLQNNRHRYYDAATGRWRQMDPIRFSGQDANLYRYVGNRANAATDPLGLVGYGQNPAVDKARLQEIVKAMKERSAKYRELLDDLDADKKVTYSADQTENPTNVGNTDPPKDGKHVIHIYGRNPEFRDLPPQSAEYLLVETIAHETVHAYINEYGQPNEKGLGHDPSPTNEKDTGWGSVKEHMEQRYPNSNDSKKLEEHRKQYERAYFDIDPASQKYVNEILEEYKKGGKK